jgi:hypothetical protein
LTDEVILSRPTTLTLAATILAAALAQAPAGAQTPNDPGPSPATEQELVQAPRLGQDLIAMVREPLRWERGEWLRFAGVAAAVGVAYQYDNDIHDDYGNPGDPDYHEVQDALPPAILFGTRWFASRRGNEEAFEEAALMRRAFVLQTISTEVIKLTFRRERPGPGVPRDHWNQRDLSLSFPSGHTATAFAVGTVFAESGDDRQRAWRRIIGYGIGTYVGYQRVNHDAHWFSDTVAGAALGIWTANFVMKRHEGTEPRGVFGLVPIEGGSMLTYRVPLRR